MLGVYIHIPFCKRICSYCDFCRVFYQEEYVNKYLDSLKREIRERYRGEDIDSIYIGGGTPSSLSLSQLKYLLEIIKIFKLKDNYEYTIECNPEDINNDKLRLFYEYGINRISIGVESFNKDVCSILDRGHSERMVFEKIKLAKRYFNNINIDLIYGVNNDINIVKGDIHKFLELDITHVSCYSLIIEEHTKMYLNNYKYIDEDIDYEMYKYISDTLSNNGYIHYEISNYAKEGYQSIHNKNYWKNGEYYGFGLSAVSYLKHERISNTKNLSKYLNNCYLDSKIYEDIKMRKENTIMLGLRLIDGININDYNKEYQDDLLRKDIIKELIIDGCIEIDNNNLRIKKEYLYLQNSILNKIIGML